jgi:Ala-tRNA(Pro) deacylase
MALNHRVTRFLEEHGVRYEVLPHQEVFTSQDVARTAHVSGNELAKAVLIRHEFGGHFLVVLPATEQVKLNAVHRAIGLDRLTYATEAEVMERFPHCHGALPPFGHLFGVPTYLDPCLLEKPWVAFQAGSHRELIRVRGSDFEALLRPARITRCIHEQHEPAVVLTGPPRGMP